MDRYLRSPGASLPLEIILILGYNLTITVAEITSTIAPSISMSDTVCITPKVTKESDWISHLVTLALKSTSFATTEGDTIN